MKKTLLCLAAALCLHQGINAQEERERAVQKGDMSINIYYGYRVSNTFVKALVDESADEMKFSALGPVGLVYEYMLSNVVGLGAEFGYGVQTVSYRNYVGNSTTTFYEEELKVTNIRAQIRANFHFLKSPNFDMYGLVSLGYRGNSYTFTTNNPNDPGTTYEGVVPFGLKPGLGIRYFFTDNIGIHLELAGGTPAVAGGLSLRF